MPQRASVILSTVCALALTASAFAGGPGDVLSVMTATNDDLRAMWLDYRLESVEFLTVGQGRPGVRLHQQPFRWVEGDPRRGAEEGRITILLDGSWGDATRSGVPAAAAEAAIRRAVAEWAADPCLDRLSVEEHPWDVDTVGDVTVTDFFLGNGAFGDPFAADIVFAGWTDPGSPLFRPDTLAVSATYVFVDRTTGEPTDRDGDGHMDVALNEIYFNDSFEWAIGAEPPALDVETAALHEVGHALSLGHFGPPPEAAMNPVYSGRRTSLAPIDHSGLCTVWGSSH